MATNTSSSELVVIYNIPMDFDTYSLRVFFERFIEQGGFTLFHFKNRPDISMRRVLREHYPEVTLNLPSLSINPTNSKPSISSDFDFNAYMNKSETVTKESTQELSTNTKSGFAYVESALLEEFMAKYHMKPWLFELGVKADTIERCHIALLPATDGGTLKKCEEFYPPPGLINGNVGTRNAYLVKMMRTGILSKSIMIRLKKRVPLLWNWAQPSIIFCKHSACGLEECEILFIMDIPPSYIKRDLKNFFHNFLVAGHVCDLIYLKRPSSNLKLFIKENLPLSSMEGKFENSDSASLCYDSEAASNVHDLYPFSRKAAGETKSCWVRVAPSMCEEFMRAYQGKSWNGGEGKCLVYKVKKEYTASLAFLSEFWKFGSMVNLSSSTQDPLEHFTELFLAELPPAALAARIQAARPQLWKKIEDARAKKGSMTQMLFDKKKPVPKLRSNWNFAAIPPPRCLMDTSYHVEASLSNTGNELSSDNSREDSQDRSTVASCGTESEVNDHLNTEEVHSKLDGAGKVEFCDPLSKNRSQEKSRKRKRMRNYSILTAMKASEDGSDVEEWERSEAFRDTIDEKRSAKEMRYEEEIELVWEKGGSGLNFHTDAAYWREQEGGFDERTTDEWDVDMQGYYGGRPGDYDAECRQDMDRMDRLRAGADESCFGPPSGTAPKYKRRRTTTSPFIVPCSLSPDAARRRMLVDLRTDDEPIPATKTARRNARKRNIGAFERHTRGVGRQLLESLGWRDGEGLGRDRGGRANIIVAAHRKPTDKRGLGFRNAGPCWKATGEPVSSEGTEGQVESEVLERNQESVYKNIPIDVFSAYSREQKKIFQEDFNTFFRESCKGFEEEGDSITAVLHLDKSRREKLKQILASLKNNHGLPRIDLKPFVSGGTIGPGSGGIIDPVDVGTISPVGKGTKGSINGGSQYLCSEGNKTCDSEPSS